MHRNQGGFTLPEILIGLAISSIIIAASFASYIVIKNNYDFQIYQPKYELIWAKTQPSL